MAGCICLAASLRNRVSLTIGTFLDGVLLAIDLDLVCLLQHDLKVAVIVLILLLLHLQQLLIQLLLFHYDVIEILPGSNATLALNESLFLV